MICDLEASVAALSQQIAIEEERSKVKDPRRANYSTIALSAAARRSKLIISLEDLRSKLAVAKRDYDKVAAKVRDLELALGGPSENINLTQRKHDTVQRPL